MQYLQDNNKSGVFGTISAFLIGMIPQVDVTLQITTVIFWFQVTAFAISITVGISTIIGFCRKMRRENRRDKK